MSSSKDPLTTDVVIGAGIAGLSATVEAAAGARITVLTKAVSSSESATRYAQGGVAAALSPADSPALHFEDTIQAGDGLCDEEAVRVLVHEGPKRVRDLIDWGLQFDTKNGELVFGREGAHRLHRVLHAHGEATGEMIQRTRVARARGLESVRLLKNHFTLRLILETVAASAPRADEYAAAIRPKATVRRRELPVNRLSTTNLTVAASATARRACLPCWRRTG